MAGICSLEVTDGARVVVAGALVSVPASACVPTAGLSVGAIAGFSVETTSVGAVVCSSSALVAADVSAGAA